MSITPCLWFDTEGEDAAAFYTSIFPVDHFWSRLSEGGEEGPCGRLKDRYGVSWQVVPARLKQLLSDPERELSQPVMAAMLKLGKIDIAALEAAAADGEFFVRTRPVI